MLTNPKFLFKYASRSRPNNFFRGLDNIIENIQTDAYQIICSLDIDDVTMISKEVKDRINSYEKVKAYWGFSKNKVYAINRDLEFAGDFQILINFSDDQIFTTVAFDTIIAEAMEKHFPDTDGFLHFHDNKQNRLATMSIIGKKWFDRFGFIYHNSYKSEWADNDAQEIAKILGKYKYMGDGLRIMDHINPYVGHKEAMDDLYKRNSEFVKYDRENFFKRQDENFGL